MPFEIVRNDITNMQVDAIVNTANPRPVIGSGTDAAIHAKAGPMLLLTRKCIGTIRTGEAHITPGFRLPAKYVIHTVGPVWEDGEGGGAALLRQCYENSLALAKKKRLKSIAFPLISTGNYGFPKELALQVATDAIREFLEENDMDIFLVVFSKESFRLSEKLQKDIRSYIDEQYAREQAAKEYGFSVRSQYESVERIFSKPGSSISLPEEEDGAWGPEQDDTVYASQDEDGECSPFDDEIDWWDIPQFRRDRPEREEVCYPGASMPGAPVQLPDLEEEGAEEETAPAPKAARRERRRFKPKPVPEAAPRSPEPAAPVPTSLAEKLKQQDAGFSATLLRMIDQTGKKDSEIYWKANVSRQHFSKIRNNPQYQPTKSTALAFAIALELDMEQTKDLIGRAGFALTTSSRSDLIIMYFIEKRHYNIMDINAALFEFDQRLLGV